MHGGDGLLLSVLGAGDGVADNVLQEDLQDFLVDQAKDPLDAAPPGDRPVSGSSYQVSANKGGCQDGSATIKGKLLLFFRKDFFFRLVDTNDQDDPMW